MAAAFSWRRVAIALAATCLAGTALGLALADLLPGWWWSEALQHPRPQLAVAGLAGTALLLAAWPRRLALAGAALPLWAGLGLIPVAPAPPAAGGGLAVASANVHSDNPDPAAAIAILLGLDADVLAVLETTPAWAAHLAPLRAAYPVHRELLRADNFGICLYARRGSITTWEPEVAEVPSLILAIDGLRVMATHPPPPFAADYHRWWQGQLTAIAAWAAEDARSVVIGDLNATPWSAGFRRLCRDGRLAAAPGSAWRSTWLAGTPLQAAIDHVLVGPGLAISGHAVGPALRSDHRPVLARVGLRP